MIKLRKSIIVTGASSGIGKATVIKLVKLGYQVFGLARRYDKLAIAKIRLCPYLICRIFTRKASDFGIGTNSELESRFENLSANRLNYSRLVFLNCDQNPITKSICCHL